MLATFQSAEGYCPSVWQKLSWQNRSFLLRAHCALLRQKLQAQCSVTHSVLSRTFIKTVESYIHSFERYLLQYHPSFHTLRSSVPRSSISSTDYPSNINQAIPRVYCPSCCVLEWVTITTNGGAPTARKPMKNANKNEKKNRKQKSVASSSKRRRKIGQNPSRYYSQIATRPRLPKKVILQQQLAQSQSHPVILPIQTIPTTKFVKLSVRWQVSGPLP
ncbi:uncharacterized protein BDV17DRAFT_136184 [Aspergillus undulatus]|uniref:uncharacterized protein n=1 Tax=Aspergillus undulatus TaxID=1810928 RepID=UPI003CCCF4A5